LQGTTTATLDQLLGADANGLVYLNSLGIPGVAVDLNGSGKVPYSQNWNLAVQFEPIKGLAVEVAYVGNKGTHLYLPQININPRNFSQISALEAGGLDLTGNIPDPLGRLNLQGAAITISRASVLTPFVGFDPLSKYFDPSGSSIRHAFYIDVQRRVSQGLTFTANYTYGKSIDDASFNWSGPGPSVSWSTAEFRPCNLDLRYCEQLQRDISMGRAPWAQPPVLHSRAEGGECSTWKLDYGGCAPDAGWNSIPSVYH
jgi:hypothetical protein